VYADAVFAVVGEDSSKVCENSSPSNSLWGRIAEKINSKMKNKVHRNWIQALYVDPSKDVQVY